MRPSHRLSRLAALLVLACTLAAAGCAPRVSPGALTPLAQRNTNETRAVDLQVFDAWAARLGTLMARGGGSGAADRERLRMLAMADGWLAFARDEYVRLPDSPIVDETFARATSAIARLERGLPADTSVRLVVGTAQRNEEQWAELARASATPHADAALLGETAVLLVRAGRVPIVGDTLACDPAPFLARARRNLEVLLAAARPDATPRRPPVRSVYFAFDSDTIPGVARHMLDALAELLDRHPGVRVEIDGLTDPRGSDAYNLELAQRRALAIQRYLAARTLGVTVFEVRPLGRARGDADLRDLVGLARDRRVDLRVFLADGREAARDEALDGDLQVEPAADANRPQARRARSRAGRRSP